MRIYFLSFAILFSCTSLNHSNADSNAVDRRDHKRSVQIEQLIVTPNPSGHPEFLHAIQNAKKSVKLVMYHMTDNQIIDALIAAHDAGIDVQVILDRQSSNSIGFTKAYSKLSKAKVNVVKSTTAFDITHEKTMVVDDETALITAINLTNLANVTRDFGVITSDPGVVAEIISVFQADQQNAAKGLGLTPNLSQDSLIWAPVNAEKKISDFIASAKSEIVTTVENLDDPVIQAAFENASEKQNVKVRIIVPMCDRNADPLRNYPFLNAMKTHGVLARVMPDPSTVDKPYMHSKMILVDGARAYVGSVNFSKHSTTQARELGILFDDPKSVGEIHDLFEKDWGQAVEIPKVLPTNCTAQ